MRALKIFFFAYVAAWLAFAIFDFGPANERIAYFVFDNPEDRLGDDPTGDISPVYSLGAYRVETDHVMQRLNGKVQRFDDCMIYDAGNWTCQYGDGSGTIGFAKGYLVQAINTVDFPDLAATIKPKTGVSRFRYTAQNCASTVEAQLFVGIIACLIGPFAA